MLDTFGRDINYLRLSVTDLCMLRCVYCMPEEGVKKLSHSDILSVEEIGEIARQAGALGINKVRITGGEPLVRKGIIEICKAVKSAPGIKTLCMTTNALLLPKYAPMLKDSGVERLNISLNTLDEARYRQISRTGSLKEALDGIEAAKKYGFDIKINCVLLGGVNDEDIAPLARYTYYGIPVRFIELMKIGEAAKLPEGRFVNSSKALEALGPLEEEGYDGVSKLYRMKGASAPIGVISPLSSHFCQRCSRIRITADGKAKACLHGREEVNVKGLSGEELYETLKLLILSKPERHHLNEGPSQSQRGMSQIGG